jgi:heparan sulfate proteoglycan 2 (perlecan)
VTGNSFLINPCGVLCPGTPPPTVRWNKAEGRFPPSAIISEGLLVIPDVRLEDAGTYICTASNAAGSVQSTVILYVRGKFVSHCAVYCYTLRLR